MRPGRCLFGLRDDVHIPRHFKLGLALLGLLALFAAGVAVRRAVLQAQFRAYGPDLPFNMESALIFRYVRLLAAGQELPAVDRQIQVPEGIDLRRTHTLAAEYIYAWGARCLPERWDLSARVRWTAVLWFGLGIPLLALWLWCWLRSAWAAGIGSAWYACSLAAVMRSTGQELSAENVALPLLIGHLALAAWARRLPRAFWAAAAGSALLLAAAQVSWDLVQFYVLAWALLHYLRLAGKYFEAPRRRWQWLLEFAALAAAGGLHPYLRAHGFLLSPAMLLAGGTALGLAWRVWRPAGPRWRRIGLALLPGALLLVAGLALAGSYAGAYGHFAELLHAKLVFLNRKPADPALLTFAQRILWSPALNSATWRLTAHLFPATLPLLFLSAVMVGFRVRRGVDPEIIQLLWLAGLALAVYVLFVRFHVFVIIFAAALLGWAALPSAPAGAPTRSAGWAGLLGRGLLLALLLAGLGVEAANTLDRPWRWGSEARYLAQRQELVQWLRANRVTEPVLANFGVSAFILAYADCPIVLHPKFEQPGIRRRVESYGETLFKADEAAFRDWAERHGAAWYVHSLGEFAEQQPELQMRYCVNALQPPAGAAARQFEFQPDRLRYFQWLWGNAKYRVFRIIRRADEREAAGLAGVARAALQRGDLGDAELRAAQALLRDPHCEPARQVLLHAGSLREQGFRGAGGEAQP